MRLLVADDDDTFRTRLVRALTDRNIETYGAATSAEALSIAAAHDITDALDALTATWNSGW